MFLRVRFLCFDVSCSALLSLVLPRCGSRVVCLVVECVCLFFPPFCVCISTSRVKALLMVTRVLLSVRIFEPEV